MSLQCLENIKYMANQTAIDPDKIRNMILTDKRFYAFRDIMSWINYERVEGDILEFGVGAGVSLLMFAYFHHELISSAPHWLGDKNNQSYMRKIFGFDSFAGLPSGEGHMRWKSGMFGENYRHDHPFLKEGNKLKPEYIYQMFSIMGYESPELQVGLFDKTISKVIPSQISKAAIIHIDSDLYESCKTVLDSIEPILQQGTMIMFDEWFAFKGDPAQGESRAFREFLEQNTHLEAIEYKQYSHSCKSFIINERKAKDPLHC